MAKISPCLSFAAVACLLVAGAECGPLPNLFGSNGIIDIAPLAGLLRLPGKAVGDITTGATALGTHLTGILSDSMDSSGQMLRKTMAGVAKFADISNLFGPAADGAAAPLASRDAPPAAEPPAAAEKPEAGAASANADAAADDATGAAS